MEIKKTHLNIDFKYICKNCNFYSNNKTDFNRHNDTAKHKKCVFGNDFQFLEIKKQICLLIYLILFLMSWANQHIVMIEKPLMGN